MWHQVLLGLLVTAASAAWPVIADEPSGLSDAVRAYTKDAPAAAFDFALVDLNDDGILDAVVLLRNGYCGSGGCDLLILRGHGGGFTLVSESTISNQPIKVSRERRHGWHTLLVLVQGGGIQSGMVVMPFNGRRYPFNPSVQPRATPAQVDAATALVFQRGGTP
jgi:hypothetical protein